MVSRTSSNAYRAWPGAWHVSVGLSPNNETPTIVPYLQKLHAVSNQDQNTPCQTIVPENNTLPRQKLWPLPDCWAENNTLPRQKLWKTYPWGQHIPSAQSIARAPSPGCAPKLLCREMYESMEALFCNESQWFTVSENHHVCLKLAINVYNATMRQDTSQVQVVTRDARPKVKVHAVKILSVKYVDYMYLLKIICEMPMALSLINELWSAGVS